MEPKFQEGDVKKLKTISVIYDTCIEQPQYINQYKYFNETVTISGVILSKHSSQPEYFIKNDGELHKYYEEWFIQ